MDLHGASLDDLAVFLAVCRGRGFREAGRRLGLSASTVSERLQRLEARLGVPLLVRTTRSVTPTAAGRTLAARLEPLLEAAGLAVQDAMNTGDHLRGTLTLNVPGAVMVDILPPLIERFLALHPDVHVELIVDDRFVDAFAAGADAGIRYGERLSPDMIAVPIGPAVQQGAIAAAPSYLKRHKHPVEPNDLLEHAWIQTRFSSGRLIGVELERDGQVLTLDLKPRLIISTAAADAAIRAAIHGVGCIELFRNWLDPHFASGALVPLLQDWWPTFDGPRLYFPSRHMSAPLRAFVNLLAVVRAEAA